MLTNVAVRWREKFGSYRPAGEVIDTRRYEVAAIADDTTPRTFIERHHYSGSYVAARFRFGLYRASELVGVAVFSHPSNDRVLTNLFPGRAVESVELGRFVLFDDVPGNGETWFLARCFEGLRAEGLLGVVSHSDPLPRANLDGSKVFGGHLGGIYQAHNAVYLGRSKRRTLRLLPDGKVFNERTLSKIRGYERGWESAVESLVSYGAEPMGDRDATEWVKAQLARITRPLRHPGNHKYAWALNRFVRKHVARLPSLPYPKIHLEAA